MFVLMTSSISLFLSVMLSAKITALADSNIIFLSVPYVFLQFPDRSRFGDNLVIFVDQKHRRSSEKIIVVCYFTVKTAFCDIYPFQMYFVSVQVRYLRQIMLRYKTVIEWVENRPVDFSPLI